MAKGKRPKDKQYNGQRKTTKGQIIKWSKENDKRTNIVCPFVVFYWPLYCLSFCRFPLAFILFVLLSFSFGHYIVCPLVVFLWPLYCLSFCRSPFAIIVFVLLSFSFGLYIVCPLVVFLWPLYCLSFGRFPFAIILNTIMAKGERPKDKQYNGQRKTTKEQTI
jgi:hypothetical protein